MQIYKIFMAGLVLIFACVSYSVEDMHNVNDVSFTCEGDTLVRWPLSYSGEAVVPQYIRHIGSGAFHNCALVEKVRLPEGLESIGKDAFSYCTSMSEILVPSSVTNIGSRAFLGCRALSRIELPAAITRIPAMAFSDCCSIKSVHIPVEVDSLGIGAFQRCYSLIEVKLPEHLEVIEDRSFMGCKSMERIDVPEGVATIGDGAFSSCGQLKSVTLPKSLRRLGDCVFDGCKALQVVSFQGGIPELNVPISIFEGVATNTKVVIGHDIDIVTIDVALWNKLHYRYLSTQEAIKIAEDIIVCTYGKTVIRQRPWVCFDVGEYYVIKGYGRADGDVAYAVISKKRRCAIMVGKRGNPSPDELLKSIQRISRGVPAAPSMVFDGVGSCTGHITR